MDDVYTCTAVRVMQTHVLSGIWVAITEPAPGIWDLNAQLVLFEHHPRLCKVGSLLQLRPSFRTDV
jgi:hypothetical protein